MPAELSHTALLNTDTSRLLSAEPGPPARAGSRYSIRRGIPTSSWFLLVLLLLLSGGATTAYAQTAPPPECSQDEKFANTWYFGYKAGLDFNAATDSIPPNALTDGQMTAPAGAGVMSDGNGKILFYSNGDTIWNGNHTIMTNGTGMGGNRLVTDGPLPIRMPGSPPPTMPGAETRYLIFTQDARGGPKGLSYSEIIIPAGGGPGTVVAATKNTPLTQGTTEKMTGVFHKNGCDIWIIVHGWGNAKSGTANRGDAFLAYRVRTTGVDPTPIISTVGSLHASSVAPMGYRGQMKVTPDGQQLAVARFSEVVGDSSSSVELFNFDAGTGRVSNPKIIDSKEGGYYGVEFSPGRSRLYATVLNPLNPQLLQFNISGTGTAGKQVIPLRQRTPVNLGSMQAAPDGKIYVARENQPALGFIAYPDSLGARARYADDSLKLGGRRSGLGLVNFNQSSLLRVGFGAQSTACLEFTFQAPPIDFDSKTYAWNFGDGTQSTVENPTHTYPAPGNYVVTLRITTACFCRQSQGLIRVPGPPTPGSIGASQPLCAGAAPAPLTSTAAAGAGTGQFTYQWQSSPDNSTWADIGGANGPSFAPGALTVTTYFRRLVSSGFCAPRTPSASVTITVLPVLVAGGIVADQTVCAGTAPAPLTSTAPATGGSGTFTYQWQSSPDNSTWTDIGGANGPGFAPGALTVTTYFRRLVSSGFCAPRTPSTSVTITVLPVVVAGGIAADRTVCAGTAPVQLTSTTPDTGGTGQFTYQWQSSPDNSTWTDIGGATNPTYAPGALTVTTYFRRLVSSGTGICSTAVSNVVAVRVQPLVTPTVTLAAPPVQCPDTPLTFTTVFSNAGPAPTFRWFVNNVAVASGPTFTSSTLVTGDQVRVEVTPTAGLCSTGVATATVIVTRTSTPLPALTIDVQPGGPVCPGAPLTFSIASVSNAGPALTYQWLVDGNAMTGATTPVYTSTTLRQGQIVTLRLRTTNGCGQPVTVVSNGVAARISPPVDVDAGPDKEILAGTSVTLEGRADGTYPVTWTPATGLTFFGNDQLRPSASPTVTTTYTLSAGAGGCADSDEVTVTVRPPIRIPNAFTPNGDGRDDTWQIEFIEQFPDNTVTVFNRWGNRIFSADNYSRANEWRGDINGQPAPVGTYYYVVITKGPLGKSYSGSITVLY
ncbi:T9SS type B sorting domain-containing protein [Hymenobacter frigidus]|uniref:T9SS type B sorting domain-containing protein n=1 Tax=Hymenobacter frigidus TaxID=1524095 RepID=UPI001667A804|nr:gliding motility-associated C-terminal domain-containing protein [Hymenobacter frigidus]